MSDVVWVYLERSAEVINEMSLQALASLGNLVKGEGTQIEGVCVGGDDTPLKTLPEPLSRVHHLLGEVFHDYTADVFAAALEELVVLRKPSALVFPATIQGEDLASMLGAGLGVGTLLGAEEIRRDGDRLIATRVEYEGKVAVDYELRDTPAIMTLEPGVSDIQPGTSAQLAIEGSERSPSSTAPRVRVLKTELSQRTVNLREARVIVGVGAGMANKEGVERAQELAGLVGGELGATRAAVDAGWLSYDRQIGQTGVKVKPDLYVACGISGVAQHRVGVVDSGTIVSINIDSHAPIFRFSHYCVEGDLKVVLPKLIELLKT
jgi:electron transfer flavoprotein alpha subunit